MKKTVAALAALTMALGLAACQEEPVPTPNPEPAPAEPGAVMSEDRLSEVLADIADDLASGDAAGDAEELGERIIGPAREMRMAEYALSSITAGASTVTPLATDPQSAVVVASTEWPRVVDVITTIPTGSNLPLLLTLVQEGPRDPYSLWSWVRLLPGVETPATTRPATGSPAVAPDAEGLLMSPQDALEAYVDLLNNRDESEFAGQFADDQFRVAQWETVDSLAVAVEAAGTVDQTSVVNEQGPYSIATHDGGAIVVGVIDQQIALARTVEGATLSVGPLLAYGEDASVVGTLTATYLATVALYVPPEGTEGAQITVLGAEQAQTGVTRDDSTAPEEQDEDSEADE